MTFVISRWLRWRSWCGCVFGSKCGVRSLQ